MHYRRLLIVILVLALGWGGIIRAQEEPAPAEPTLEIPADVPTEVPTATPVVVPTETPTDVPTEAPTNIPTEVPTDVPTDVATEVPTEAATEIATEEPTAVVTSAPPVVNIDGSVILEATAGVAATFQFTVSDDEAGLVRVGAAEDNSSTAIIEISYTDPVETASPFNTGITLSYTAPADFVGLDSLKLKAIDPGGITIYFTLTINVTPAIEATLEPTVEPTAMPDKVRIINYNPAATEESIQAMLAALGAIEVSRIPQIGAMKVYISQTVSSTETAIAAVNTNAAAVAAGLTSVEPEIIYHIDAFPNDPLYPQQWALADDTVADGGTNVNFAWNISVKDGLGVTVAVLDSGIDTTHPDLVGKMLLGWDFVNDDNNTDDDNGHGTHVSGIIAAKTNNAIGIAGVAYNAKLLPIKVCNNLGLCSNYDIAAGLVFATDKGAKVANLSLGGGQISTTIEGAVQYAISRNVTVVAAAGNTGDATLQYPASFDGVISVASHDINGNHAPTSTANDHVTISAPGVAIISTYPPEFDSDGPADGYYHESGTSMAAPHVSGIVALMISDNVVKTPAAAKEALICSAYDSGGDGYDFEFGYGLVQADLAQNWNENSGTCKVPALNDLYQNAITIATVPYTTVQLIHSRSVTSSPSDPFNSASLVYCAPPEQSLWYKFKPAVSDYYQISTLGSTYDTQVSVWQLPEEGNTSTNFIGCNDQSFGLFTDAAMLNVPLTAGQTYYIMVDSYDSADDELLNLDVRRSMFNNNVDYQETSPNIAYVGTWLQTAAAGAAGGQVKTTSDFEAMAVFTFRGTSLDIARTIGPNQDDFQVWIDGNLETIIFNRAAVMKRNQVWHYDLCICNTPGLWHQVVLMRVGSPGSIDIDRIRTYDALELPNVSITALTDDGLGGTYPCAAKRFCYTGGAFTSVTVLGAHLGKVSETVIDQATVSFRATGSSITIFRTTGPGYGTMDVQVDGELVGDDVSNESTSIHAKVPYVISGLGVYSHVVQIINTAGSTLQFDAAQASTPTAIAASATTMTNENAATLIYGGYWTNRATPGTVGNTIRQTSEVGASVSFNYTGNWFRIGYLLATPRATVNVFEDNHLIGTITDPGGADGIITYWDTKSNLQSDRTHTVRLVLVSGTFELDSVGARRQAIITPSMGVVQESNAAVSYDLFSGAWTTTTARSLGGYVFQGGAAKRATTVGANLTFYANGTGFILYTSIGPSQDAWEVWVDGVLYQPLVSDVSVNFVDLFNTRYRPIAYGITGLAPGIHVINLVKHTAGGSVDFDAVRVFP